MTVDNTGITDEVAVEVNGAPVGQEPPIPDKPTMSSRKSDWGAYVVALGLHPDYVNDYTIDELMELSERFGG